MEMREKWADALESGAYKQGTGTLVARKFDGVCHCCLGVAAQVIGIPQDVLLVEQLGDLGFERQQGTQWKDAEFTFADETSPTELMDLLGLEVRTHNLLIIFNDSGNYSFKELAALIRQGNQAIYDEFRRVTGHDPLTSTELPRIWAEAQTSGAKS